MKVALVHYWLVGMRGGERVLETLCDLFPNADIFTLVLDPSAISSRIARHRIKTSFLQRIGGRRHYRRMLPLMPFALEALDLGAYDLVISSEAGPAKGIIPRPDALHICYCHSPMRYLWDLRADYLRDSGWVTRTMLAVSGPALRQWDVTTAARVDHFIANSRFVAQRIEKYYRRPATVIHPPVDLARFAIAPKPADYFLCAGQITPSKRIDLAVEVFSRNGLPLRVIGEGVTPQLRAAASANVRFLGPLDKAGMEEHFAQCQALVFPGVEDFGIVPLEVMASGRPVIAFSRGGATETILAGRTGLFFDEQTPQSLADAVRNFVRHRDHFDPLAIRAHAAGFDGAHFAARLRCFIEARLAEHRARDPFPQTTHPLRAESPALEEPVREAARAG